MPATVFLAPHGSDIVGRRGTSSLPQFTTYEKVDSPQALLRHSTIGSGLGVYEADSLQSSFKDDYGDDATRTIHAAQNGFLQTCIRPYFEHLHLVLRPEDIWLAILTQLNMYILKNSEELRSRFVEHEGKKFLEVPIKGSTKKSLNFPKFAQKMTEKMQEHIIDKELSEWVIPNFSTTTEHDKVIARPESRRPLVQDKMRRADAVLEKIMATVSLWDDRTVWETREDWKRLRRIKQKLEEGEQRMWMSNPPWEGP